MRRRRKSGAFAATGAAGRVSDGYVRPLRRYPDGTLNWKTVPLYYPCRPDVLLTLRELGSAWLAAVTKPITEAPNQGALKEVAYEEKTLHPDGF